MARPSRVRNESALRTPGLLSEQRQGTARLHGSERDHAVVAAHPDTGGPRGSFARPGRLQPRARAQALHREHQLQVPVRSARVLELRELPAGRMLLLQEQQQPELRRDGLLRGHQSGAGEAPSHGTGRLVLVGLEVLLHDWQGGSVLQ